MSSLGELSVLGEIVILNMCLENVSVLIFSITSLAVRGLRLCDSTVWGTGLISGPGTKIPHALWHGLKKTA